MGVTSKLVALGIVVVLLSSAQALQAGKKKPAPKKSHDKTIVVEKAAKNERVVRQEPAPVEKRGEPVEASRSIARESEARSMDCEALERRTHELGEEEKQLESQASEKKEQAVALLRRAQAAEQQRITLVHADHVKSRSRVNNERALQEKERERVEFHRESDKRESERVALNHRAKELERERESLERERKARCEVGNVAQHKK
jgi:hypothetical protein